MRTVPEGFLEERHLSGDMKKEQEMSRAKAPETGSLGQEEEGVYKSRSVQSVLWERGSGAFGAGELLATPSLKPGCKGITQQWQPLWQWETSAWPSSLEPS